MRRPVAGEVHVHYGQIYVESDPDGFGPGLAEAFAGQGAGLCGAAVPGALWLTTGLHTGDVGFTVEVHDQAPPPDPAWEDAVEASFRPLSASSSLVQWAGEAAWPLGLEETDYRVRYCAKGMDAGHREDTRLSEEPRLDEYLLQFWPAPPAPDRILRQTSRIAAYWHDHARRQPPPPTPAERAEAELRARLAEERAAEERRIALEQRQWGGRSPSPALRDVGGNVRGLVAFAPGLVHAIDAAGPEAQRATALLAARLACETAGLTEVGWIAEGLTALIEGRPLPPPFDDTEEMWRTLASDPDVPVRTVARAVPPRLPPLLPPSRPDGPTPAARLAARTGTPAPRPRPRPREEVPAPAPRSYPRGEAAAPESGPAARAGASDPAPHPHARDETPAPGLRAPAPIVGPAARAGEWRSASCPSVSRSGEGSSYAVFVTQGEPDPFLRMSQPHMALPALLGAAEPDPLRAALDAVFAAVAAYGEDHPALLREIRSALPEPS
ncbi:hypothetical protein [Streptomyces sp. NRRL WC-3626]|uniref:hypothetical protein n=1 Tax=Streptomyces sp. NRRL WC-3626 TaxID=1463926 RepID=UPI0004BF8931|nr:hypothetical protein [Streptomyces sp. NRRL WC-3626]